MIPISQEHQELSSSIMNWAKSLAGREKIRAVETDLTFSGREFDEAAAEFGLTSLLISESAGGGGGGHLDLAVVLEAAAYELHPGSGLVNAILQAVLPELSELVAEPNQVGLVFATDFVVTGEVVDFSGLAYASFGTSNLLVVSDNSVGVVDTTAVELIPGRLIDLTRRVGLAKGERVDFTPVAASAAKVQQRLVCFAAAEASGIARWCLDTAVAYAAIREQFGQKIGGFQAIKHLAAEMLESSEAITAAAWDLAAVLDTAYPAQAEIAVAVATTTVFDATVNVAKTCIQILGGIGFTFEHDAHLFLRRALSLRAMVDPTKAAGQLADFIIADQRRVAKLDFAGADEQYRPEIKELVAKVAASSDPRAALAETGLLTPHWQAPYGRSANAIEQLVIDEELTAAKIIRPDLKIAAWAVPTILAHGTPEQQQRFVQPSLLGQLSWCQLFSEPGAGSDLASLKTKAIKVDGGWELTGQKVWTSLAAEADWGICLARTDAEAKPHAGISYFLVEMKSAGIDIRPLREMTGEEMFNEVFLDRVFVPEDCLVGDLNGGWKLARTTLANERVAMAGAGLGDEAELLVQVGQQKELSSLQKHELGQVIADAIVVSLLGNRTVLRSIAQAGPGPESSVAKLLGVKSRQAAADLTVTLLSDQIYQQNEVATEALHRQLLTRCLSIAGGTTQILRNVAAERILGLPR